MVNLPTGGLDARCDNLAAGTRAGVRERRGNSADSARRRGDARRLERLERRRPAAGVAPVAERRHDIQRPSQLARQTVSTDARRPTAS